MTAAAVLAAGGLLDLSNRACSDDFLPLRLDADGDGAVVHDGAAVLRLAAVSDGAVRTLLEAVRAAAGGVRWLNAPAGDAGRRPVRARPRAPRPTLRPVQVPFLSGRHVEQAVSPAIALEAVREAFVAYARGEWTMPPKVYVPAYPDGDFRAMPALGGGHALLKWVASFPGNPARGLPTVTGLVLLSDASDGQLLAVLDAAAVTALRTGAAAVLAAETLGRADAGAAAVIGTGVNGRAAARTFLARGRDVLLWDVDAERAGSVARELGVRVAASRDEALGADVVVTVTPGREIVLGEGSLRPGQHASLMGADGPDKAEIAVAELARVRVFCDDWEQASHNGEIAHAVEAGAIERGRVTQLGDVLAGSAPGRRDDEEATVFDSTGLAIQDLAIARAAHERLGELGDVPLLDV